MNYMGKIEAIRIAAGLGRLDMSALMGVGSSEYEQLTQETREVSLQEITRIADSPMTKRFIVWLMSGRVVPGAGQISPDIARYGLGETIWQH